MMNKDSEVMTMEIVGEFLGKDYHKTIWESFKQHGSHFFPRTHFIRQAANLDIVKYLLQNRLAIQLKAFSETLQIIDGLPYLSICKGSL